MVGKKIKLWRGVNSDGQRKGGEWGLIRYRSSRVREVKWGRLEGTGHWTLVLFYARCWSVLEILKKGSPHHFQDVS
jgi:hypothetical protein